MVHSLSLTMLLSLSAVDLRRAVWHNFLWLCWGYESFLFHSLTHYFVTHMLANSTSEASFDDKTHALCNFCSSREHIKWQTNEEGLFFPQYCITHSPSSSPQRHKWPSFFKNWSLEWKLLTRPPWPSLMAHRVICLLKTIKIPLFLIIYADNVFPCNNLVIL